MKAYKGFNPDMTCRGFQYEEEKEYETDSAEICEKGFHACEHPLDCFAYYPPSRSVYHEVEQSGEMSRVDGSDTKVASTKIKIGARLSIAQLVEAAVEYVKEKTIPKAEEDGYQGAASATGYQGAASATGDQGAASATGDQGAASATGYQGAASATGDRGAASATGYRGAASATGYQGAASATGYRGAASATGDQGAASATGYRGAASATGDQGAASAEHETAVAVAWGVEGKAKGVIGSHLVLAEWIWDDDENRYKNIGAKIVQVDGEDIKADTYYALEGGEVVEAD